MKTFMLVAMLIGLLVTMWLVMQDVEARKGSGHGAAAIKSVERAEDMRRTVEAVDKLKEKKLDSAARD